jgi:hypothetical protein
MATLLLILAAATLGSGCSRSAGTVYGVVTYKGRTLKSGSIVFHGAENSSATSEIDSDGAYRVHNLPPGPAKIGVDNRTFTMPTGSKNKEGAKKGKAESKDTLPAGLGNPDTSGLTCTVRGGTQEHNIDIP